jgi:glycosyltransferase involved in cell wall biosynthesis
MGLTLKFWKPSFGLMNYLKRDLIMVNDITISIILPAYAEAANLPQLIHELENTFSTREDFEILIVNDENPDGSVQIINKLMEQYNNVKGIFSEKRLGKTKAIKIGLNRSKGDVVVVMDADLQYLSQDVPKLIKMLDKADVVNGCRVNRKDSFLRIMESRIYNLLIRLLFRVNFKDNNSGLKVFKRKVMEEIISQPMDGLHRYFLVLAVKKGYKVIEVPIQHRPRIRSASKFSSSPFKLLRGFIDLIYVWRYVHSTASQHAQITLESDAMQYLSRLP